MAVDGRETTPFKPQITKEPLIKSRLPLFYSVAQPIRGHEIRARVTAKELRRLYQ
jgi:hypothetical protein